MKLAPLVTAIAGFMIGVAAGTAYAVPAEVIVLLLLLSLTVGLVRRKESFRTDGKTAVSSQLLLIGLVLFTTALGLWRSDLAKPIPSDLAQVVGEEVDLIGIVVREPDVREVQQLLFIDIETDTILVSTDRHVDVTYGDVVNVAGTLRVPATFTTDLGREFNYPGYLLVRGVEYQISFAEVTVQSTGHGNFVLAHLGNVKEWFTQALERVLGEPYVGLGEGLLLGEKRALGESISEQFRRTGLTHIVVLSGYNVMLVVAFCLFIFSFIFGLRARVMAGLIAITLFALLVGPSATVIRASLMASLVLVAQVTGRQYDVLRALLVAGAVMILLNPYLLLYDIGFQLSFMATLGLVMFAPNFESSVATKGIMTLKGFFTATVVTQIAVLPLLVYHIGEISIISVVANMLVLPMVPAAMLLTFGAGVFALINGVLAAPLALAAQLSLAYILFITGVLAAVPLAAVVTPVISPSVVFIWYGLYGVGYWVWHLRLKSVTFPPPVPGDSLQVADWEVVEERDEYTKTRHLAGAAPKERDETPIFFK